MDAALLVAPIWRGFWRVNVSRNWEVMDRCWGGSWLIGVKSITFIPLYIYIYYSLHLINVFPNCTTNLKINGIITFKLSI